MWGRNSCKIFSRFWNWVSFSCIFIFDLIWSFLFSISIIHIRLFYVSLTSFHMHMSCLDVPEGKTWSSKQIFCANGTLTDGIKVLFCFGKVSQFLMWKVNCGNNPWNCIRSVAFWKSKLWKFWIENVILDITTN